MNFCQQLQERREKDKTRKEKIKTSIVYIPEQNQYKNFKGRRRVLRLINLYFCDKKTWKLRDLPFVLYPTKNSNVGEEGQGDPTDSWSRLFYSKVNFTLHYQFEFCKFYFTLPIWVSEYKNCKNWYLYSLKIITKGIEYYTYYRKIEQWENTNRMTYIIWPKLRS